jgi:hypothetical protein
MTRRTRTILFVVCLFFFLLAAPGVVLYSQGYRFDLEQKIITQTGAFYFKALPRDAEVYINDKFAKKTSMFTNSALLENLLPKRYEIEIRKEGYHSWSKNMEIKERHVTEAKYVILFPKDLQLKETSPGQKAVILERMTSLEQKEIPQTLAGLNFKDFAVSPDEKKIVYSTDYEVRVIFLENHYDLGKSAGDTSFLTRFSEKIGGVFWLDNYHILLSVGDEIKVTEIDNRDRPNMFDLAELKNPNLYWEKDLKTMYILSEGVLYQNSNLLP